MTTKLLPALFKKTGTGAITTWLIGTEGNVIVTTWGQVGGAMQTTRDVIAKGKNIGKKNETSAEQQAEAEAESYWTKKLKKAYAQTLDDAMAGVVDEIIAGGIPPMLAHKFSDQGHKLVYPCYTQPKLDGHRCIAVVEDDGSVTLWSRTRKPIGSMPHIQAAVAALKMKPGTVLDGELYSHAHKADFDKLTSLIRASSPRPGHEVMEYHVYDLPSSEDNFGGRYTALQYIANDFGSGPLVLVETQFVNDEDELMVMFEKYVAAGYEGSMGRNDAGKYLNKRSYDLLKIKEFDEADFVVCGVEEGRGKLAGHAIFVCKAANGNEFRAKMKGETSLLKQYFEDPTLAIGKKLEVHYFGLTGKSTVPRFPIAHRFKVDL